jgi:hypothetical protein
MKLRFIYVVPIAIQAFVQTLHRFDEPFVIEIGLGPHNQSIAVSFTSSVRVQNFMKLFHSGSPVFTNLSNNPVFQILGNDRLTSRSPAHICPFPLNKRHHSHTICSLTATSPYTSKLDGFRRCECFSRSKIQSPNALPNRRDY